MHGQFFWHDIMTTDTQSAARFYGHVVGWGIQKADADDKEYSIFTVNGQGVAGLMPIPEDAARQGAAPAWMGYVAVDDVDAAENAVRAAGAEVVYGPVNESWGLRRFFFRDPAGNLVNVVDH